MERRTFVAATAAGVLATSLSALGQEHHHHPSTKADRSGLVTEDATWIAQYRKVQETSTECYQTGLDCIRHCNEMMARGEGPAFARCEAAARQMLVYCKAMGELTSQHYQSAAELAALCSKVCGQCATECESHAKHHEECRKCMEACQRCSQACKELSSLA